MDKIEKNKFIKGNWYVTDDNNIFKFDKFVKEGNIEYIESSKSCLYDGDMLNCIRDLPIKFVSKCVLVNPKLIGSFPFRINNPDAKYYGFTLFEYNIIKHAYIKHAYINNINNFDTYDIF